jgi:predicted GNAT family N-acyltransferase
MYSEEGIKEFHRYIDPDRLAKRSSTNHFVLVAELGSDIVGMIEVREYNHISLLFIVREYQGQGIGRALLNEAIRICIQEKDGISKVTVHSSPNSVEAYKHFGFEALETERVENGIRYVPMKLRVSD